MLEKASMQNIRVRIESICNRIERERACADSVLTQEQPPQQGTTAALELAVLRRVRDRLMALALTVTRCRDRSADTNYEHVTATKS